MKEQLVLILFFLNAGLKSINIESTISESKNYLSVVAPKNKIQAEQAVEKAIGPLKRMQKTISDSIRKMEREQRKVEQEATKQ